MPAKRLRCRDCQVRLDESNCPPSALANRKSHCRSCSSRQRGAYRRENADKNRPKEQSRNLKRADARRMKTYGITPVDFEELKTRLNSCCAICRKPPSYKMGLCVDHDHATGKVRGLLCHKCNAALGAFNDDTNLLRSAISYLIDPPNG